MKSAATLARREHPGAGANREKAGRRQTQETTRRMAAPGFDEDGGEEEGDRKENERRVEVPDSEKFVTEVLADPYRMRCGSELAAGSG